jgi:nucleotide-binding universal stress UspA family protein
LELHLLKVTKNDSYQRANARLDEGKERLQEAGFEPVCSIIEGEYEKAITNYITQQDISLLLMGAYGHSRIRHLVIGSTTAQLLRSSNIPVLLFR